VISQILYKSRRPHRERNGIQFDDGRRRRAGAEAREEGVARGPKRVAKRAPKEARADTGGALLFYCFRFYYPILSVSSQ